MIMYAIEQGVQMPVTRSKFPFGDMAIGDSFFVPDAEHTKRTSSAIRSAASMFQRRVGGRFSCLNVEGGWRVWRVA